jgi:threonine dehydrogenase-like Zn-dependent dehydrogenase
MKAIAVFPGTKTVKIVEHETPRLSQPDQVMLRMLDIGICGTTERSAPSNMARHRLGMTTW